MQSIKKNQQGEVQSNKIIIREKEITQQKKPIYGEDQSNKEESTYHNQWTWK